MCYFDYLIKVNRLYYSFLYTITFDTLGLFSRQEVHCYSRWSIQNLYLTSKISVVCIDLKALNLVGPLPNTVTDFWWLVWQEQIHVVAMVTNIVERGQQKCEQYWPDEGTKKYGPFKVMLTDQQVFADYTIRQLFVSVSLIRNCHGKKGIWLVCSSYVESHFKITDIWLLWIIKNPPAVNRATYCKLYWFFENATYTSFFEIVLVERQIWQRINH